MTSWGRITNKHADRFGFDCLKIAKFTKWLVFKAQIYIYIYTYIYIYIYIYIYTYIYQPLDLKPSCQVKLNSFIFIISTANLGCLNDLIVASHKSKSDGSQVLGGSSHLVSGL